ncbi:MULTISPECIES: MFS transporter [Tsukamurella]|uniref:MFS transporter n=2 Tax=Tsukamurella TaxID=2060 RepID=A0A5C5S6Q6_9ACTN|nr:MULTISPECIES: MFS transporter [Tsukamurella]NMD56847.1 MFS transporter [Tsukamurella columbiensis]TWS30268.1 MFS transporter [Tsukamurella conjunctivitidis]
MRARVLAAACLAQLMITLDVSVVNVALPALRADLGLGGVGQQWVVTAYALPFAGFLLLGGRIADVAGVRWTFAGGLALFTAASALGGAATGVESMLAGRALQGLAAAFVAPATLAMLTTTFEEGEPRIRAMAWWTAMSIAGGTAGNLCGGVLTELFGWRAVFLVNLPLGALAVMLALGGLPTVPHEAARSARSGRPARRAPGIDPVAAALATAALLLAAGGFSAAGERQWQAAVAAGVVSALLLCAFRMRDRGTERPLLPPALLAIRSVRCGNAGMLLTGATLVPMWFFLSLQMQVVLGYSALVAGLAFLPHTVIQLLVSLRWTPRLLRRHSAPAMVAAGSGLLVAGFGWQSMLGPGSAYLTAILLPALLIGVGSGMVNLPLTTMTVSGVQRDEAGAASGIMNCAKQVGGGLGLAVIVAATAAITGEAAAYGAAFLMMAALAAVVGVGAALAVRRTRQPGNGSSV